MKATPDVSDLNRKLNTERIAFSGLRRELAAALKPFDAPHDADEHIISFAEEFGATYAAGKVASQPEFFGLKAEPNDPRLRALETQIWAAHTSREAMDVIVSEREDKLAKADPAHDRVYVLFGREFTIDMANRRVRYVDTGKVEPLAMEEVAPAASRAKQREREK